MSKIPGLRADPYPAFRFYITLIDTSSTLAKIKTAVSFVSNYILAGFSECSGLETGLDIHEYKEGGVNDYVHKFPSRAKFTNLTLKRGMGFSDDLWLWHYDYIQGKGKRKDGIIALQSESGIPMKAWVFKRGIPCKWTGPAFNAAQNAVAIESLEISHEGLELLSPHAAVAQLI